MRIEDRQAAGRLLAPVVGRQDLDDPVVVGIGEGGRAVAEEVAEFLGCPLDMLEVVPLDAGDALHPARAVGALSATGHLLVRPGSLEHLSAASSALRDAVRRARSGSTNGSSAGSSGGPSGGSGNRSGNGSGDHRDRVSSVSTWWRSVVLVDDGTSGRDVVAAAVDLVRAGRPGRVVLAIPAAPQELIDELTRLTGEVIVATVVPWVEWFHWHGRLYGDDASAERGQTAHRPRLSTGR